MAERRMFAKTIIDSDAFLDMPVTARLLYYDLSMRADDDGFVNAPKKIMRMVGASQDDLSILALRKFILPFDNGIVVIKHWRIHNYIRKDTYNETPYLEEKALLELDENKAYRFKDVASRLPVDDQSTQDRLGKVSIDNRKENIKRKEPTLEEIQEYVKEKNLNVDAKQFYDYFSTGNWIDSKGNKVKNWKQKLLTWNSYKQPKQEKVNTLARDFGKLNQFYMNNEEE